MEDIINLRDDVEALELASLSRWKEYHDQRKRILRSELERVKDALEFVETASVEQFKEMALSFRKRAQTEKYQERKRESWIPKRGILEIE